VSVDENLLQRCEGESESYPNPAPALSLPFGGAASEYEATVKQLEVLEVLDAIVGYTENLRLSIKNKNPDSLTLVNSACGQSSGCDLIVQTSLAKGLEMKFHTSSFHQLTLLTP